MKLPKNECVLFYIGKTDEQIRKLQDGYVTESYINIHTSIIEVRLGDATLTCEIHKGICIDARIFEDKDR